MKNMDEIEGYFMIRKIIRIDKNKCNGCGLCVSACHERAIGLINGKAELLRDDYCDGLGNCLPICPESAISFEEREAAEYDEAAVKANVENKQPNIMTCGCPVEYSRPIERKDNSKAAEEQAASTKTHLNQWPIQIKLIPPDAPCFNNSNLLVAADCTAYAYGNFHGGYMKDKITVIGCAKLDKCDYSEKLTAILKMNDIKSVSVARMSVPCCSGIENAVKNALMSCGKTIPCRVTVISIDGRITEDNSGE
jgi:ferredoxin